MALLWDAVACEIDPISRERLPSTPFIYRPAYYCLLSQSPVIVIVRFQRQRETRIAVHRLRTFFDSCCNRFSLGGPPLLCSCLCRLSLFETQPAIRLSPCDFLIPGPARFRATLTLQSICREATDTFDVAGFNLVAHFEFLSYFLGFCWIIVRRLFGYLVRQRDDIGIAILTPPECTDRRPPPTPLT